MVELRTVNYNQDLGDGWRLLAITVAPVGSALYLVKLSKDGKTYLSRFDIDKRLLIDAPTDLSTTQLHIIANAISVIDP